MAEISLRDYEEFVDGKLGNEAYSEAIAHCRHVLEIYPKNIDFYALWARALAAREEFQDALDLFQRVLSVDPNHFISHIGMNDCYRESDAIDQAIWHLERAFEQVPSNLDIQDEIKRLYQERDGVAPRKIQLTGGALARLYAKGKLYAQAITELTKALTKDPERLDLQILLAEVLWDNHQYVDAGHVAGEVLKRLPNSVGANAVLYKLWRRAGKPEEASQFLARVREIDPYLAYELEAGTDAPKEAATINQLAYSAEQHAVQTGAADWVAQLDQIEKSASVTAPTGPTPSKDGDVDAPDWLKNIGTGTLTAPAGMPAPAPASPATPTPSSVDAPDWLNDVLAGEGTPATEAPAVDVPDWMKEIAGDETPPPVSPAQPAPAVSGGDAPDWLNDVLAEETPAGVAPPAGSGEAPDWLKETLEPEQTPAADMPAVRDEEQAPDWLQDIAQETPPPAPDETPVPSGPPGREAPDWLKDILTTDQPAQPAMSPASQEVSADWLDDLLTEGTPVAAAGRPPTQGLGGAEPAQTLSLEDMGELETWDGLATTAAGEVIEERTKTRQLSEEHEFRPIDEDWLGQEIELETPQAEAEAIEEQKSTRQLDLSSSMTPINEDWLKQDTGLELPQAEEEAEPAEDEMPEWLAGAMPVEQEADSGAASTEDAQEEEAVPDWLSEAPVVEEEESEAEESAAEDAVPDWLTLADEVIDEVPVREEEQEAEDAVPDWLQADTGASLAEAGEDEDDGDVPDWLAGATPSADMEAIAETASGNTEEDLTEDSTVREEAASVAEAAQVEAPPAEPLTPTLEEGEKVTPPDDDNGIPDFLLDGDLDDSDAALAWLEELAAKYDPTYEGGSAAAEPAAVAEAEPEPEPEAEPEVAAPPVAEAEPAAAAVTADDGLPDWLKADSAAAPADEDLEWLRAPAEGEPALEAAAVDDEIPDWLKSAKDAEPELTPVAEAAAEPAAPPPAIPAADDALDWLDQQVAGQGVDTSAVISEALTPDQPPVKATLDIPAPDAEAEPASSDDLPDWLRGVDTEAEAERAIDMDQKALDQAISLDEIPEQAVEDEELAWLTDTLEAEEKAAEMEGLEDLLVEEKAEEEPAPVAAAEPAAAEDEEIPDWLKGAEEPAAEPVEAAAPPAPPPAPPEPVAETPPEPAPPEPEPVAAAAEPIPDWLAGARDTSTDVGLDEFLKAVAPAEAEAPEPAPAPPAPPAPAPVAEAAPPPATPAAPPAGTATTPVASATPLPSIDNPDAHLQKARDAMTKGEWDTAFTAYEELVANGKMLHEAIADLSNYVKSQPVVKPRVYRIVGDALMTQGKLDDALDMYRQALDKF